MEEKGHLKEQRKCGEWEGRESGGVLGSRRRGQPEHVKGAPHAERGQLSDPPWGRQRQGRAPPTHQREAAPRRAVRSRRLSRPRQRSQPVRQSRGQQTARRQGEVVLKRGSQGLPPTSSPLCRLPHGRLPGAGQRKPCLLSQICPLRLGAPGNPVPSLSPWVPPTPFTHLSHPLPIPYKRVMLQWAGGWQACMPS